MTGELETMPDVLTVAEAARILRIGKNQAYEAIKRGDIPSLKIGKKILISRVALQHFLAGRL